MRSKILGIKCKWQGVLNLICRVVKEGINPGLARGVKNAPLGSVKKRGVKIKGRV